MVSNWLRGVVSGLGLFVPFALAAGCSSASEMGTVSGRVLFNGKPLPGGFVLFRPANPRLNSVTVEIDEQGNYQAVVPAGDVKVSVDNRELEPRNARDAGPAPALPADLLKKMGAVKPDTPPPEAPADAPDRPSGRYVPIPEKYSDTAKSGLGFTVFPGEQNHDIVLSK